MDLFGSLYDLPASVIDQLRVVGPNVSLLPKLTYVGAGQYNICFTFEVDGGKYIVKIRRYNSDILQNIASLFEVYKRMSFILPGISEAQVKAQLDAFMKLSLSLKQRDKANVSYKMGLIGRQLFQHMVTPHFQVVLAAADVKNAFNNVLSSKCIPKSRMKDLQKLLSANSLLSSMYNQLHIEPCATASSR